VTKELVVSIAHELPGRLRLRLSSPSRAPAKLEQAVGSHPGFLSVQCSPVSGSVLVHHDVTAVRREEVVLRVALAYSLERGGSPVRVVPLGAHEEMSDGAWGAGLALVAAAAARWLLPLRAAAPLLQGGAALLTAGAVVQHGAEELRQRGQFDPEVLSLAYLVLGVLRGQALSAAALTWLATFGRHLGSPRRRGVLITPAPRDDGVVGWQVVVRPADTPGSGPNVRDALASLLRHGLGGFKSLEDGLLQQVRRLGNDHDDVLEGLGDLQLGIPLMVEG